MAALRIRWIFWLVVLPFLCACGRDKRVHRGAPPGVVTGMPDAGLDGGTVSLHTFLQQSPAVVLGTPTLMRSSICPGMQIMEVARTHSAVPTDVAEMLPLRYAVDDMGRRWTMREVLLCELKILRWIEEGTSEGSNMTTWRGPWIFEPDDECLWREPYKIDVITRDGALAARRLTFRHRCRRHGRGNAGWSDHQGSFTLDADYNHIEVDLK